MGSFSKFECPDCGYSAEVSGGPDRGMKISVETSICTRCKELIDVITEVYDCENPDLEKRIGKCPKCRRKKCLIPWNPEERLCPRCGGRVGNKGPIGLWD
jgi:DNA-directed RNA polymerase subunit M/transcription elongation factor TFIIS